MSLQKVGCEKFGAVQAAIGGTGPFTRPCRKAGKFKGKWNFRNLGNLMERILWVPRLLFRKNFCKKVEILLKSATDHLSWINCSSEG